MPIQIKDVNTLTQKYTTRAGAAAADYKAGVMAPRNSWQTQTANAADAWGQGVTAAVSSGSFAKGVNKTGDAGWQSASANKGAQRYPQGVSAGGPAWAAGVGPYLQVLAGLTLPPRGPRRSPQNINRVAAVNTALAAKKTGG